MLLVPSAKVFRILVVKLSTFLDIEECVAYTDNVEHLVVVSV